LKGAEINDYQRKEKLSSQEPFLEYKFSLAIERGYKHLWLWMKKDFCCCLRCVLLKKEMFLLTTLDKNG